MILKIIKKLKKKMLKRKKINGFINQEMKKKFIIFIIL